MEQETTPEVAPAEQAEQKPNAINAAIDAAEGENVETPAEKAQATETAEEAKPAEEVPKKEKTPEEREISKLQNRVDKLTRKLREREERGHLQSSAIESTNRTAQDDSEELRLTRSELARLINERATQIAPEIASRNEEQAKRRKVVEKLTATWGQETFDLKANDLNRAFNGLADDKGRPKPATDAIFEADEPAVVIDYLADPENWDEAEAIARMGPVQAGRAIARLEAKLMASKAEAKPKPSKVPAPIEPIRGQGTIQKSLADLSDAEFAKRRREMKAARR
jgi:hypothetical protein